MKIYLNYIIFRIIKKFKLLIQRGNNILSKIQNTLHYLNSRNIKNMFEKEESIQTKILSDKQKFLFKVYQIVKTKLIHII